MARRVPWDPRGPEWAAEARAKAKAEKAAERWGVFAWEAENMYRTADAVRVYKREAAAQAYADKCNAEAGTTGNLVVRKIR